MQHHMSLPVLMLLCKRQVKSLTFGEFSNLGIQSSLCNADEVLRRELLDVANHELIAVSSQAEFFSFQIHLDGPN